MTKSSGRKDVMGKKIKCLKRKWRQTYFRAAWCKGTGHPKKDAFLTSKDLMKIHLRTTTSRLRNYGKIELLSEIFHFRFLL